MRLLNIETLAFEEFNYGEAPEYAILSHTWEADEVLYHDILNSTPDRPPRKKGFRKIQRSCQRAREDDFEWIWIDTCCIDKVWHSLQVYFHQGTLLTHVLADQ